VTPAERTGLFGAVLLAGGIVAASILLATAGRTRPAEEEPEPEPAAAPPAPPEPEPDPDPGAAETPEGREVAFRREVKRLREEIARRDDRIRRLERMLRAAGVSLEEKPPEPVVAVRAAIEDLQKCGPETAPGDVEMLLRRIEAAGEPGVSAVMEFLETGRDVAYSAGWSRFGDRFTSYPGMRAALIDVLGRIGGVEGQTALVSLLRRNRDGLEICMLVDALRSLRDLRGVADVMTEASRRYLDLPIPPREQILVRSVLETLAAQEPEAAARDLLRYFRDPDRSAARAEAALRHLGRLPDPVATAALAEAAGDPDLDERAARAAAELAERSGEGVAEALRGVLAKAGEEVRKTVYRGLGKPLKTELESIEKRGEGLEAVAGFESVVARAEARLELLRERLPAEERTGLTREIDQARTLLDSVRERAARLRKGLVGD